MNRVKNMTKGNPLTLILVLAFPLMIANIGQQFYMIVDAMIVGQGVGVEALASVGAADWSYWMALWEISAMTQGFAVPVSQYFGENDYSRVRKAVVSSVWLCAAAAVLLTAVGLLFGPRLLVLLQTPENILKGATEYLLTMYAGLAIVTAYNMAAALLRAFGDGRTPLIAIVIAAVMNIGLDMLFVFVFGWGIIGAAVATLLAQLFAFLYCLRILARIQWLRLKKEELKLDKKTAGIQCRLGIPLGLQQMLVAVGGMILQSAINRQGFELLAGFTATNKIYGLLESSAISLGYAMTTYTAQNYGAGLYRRIRKGLKCSVILGVLFSVAVSVLMFVLGRFILMLFIDQGNASADEVLEIAYQYLMVLSIFLVSLYMLHVFRNTLQGLGNASGPFLSGIMEFVGRVSIALFFTRIWGGQMIFLAEPFAWIAATVALVGMCIWELHKMPKEDKGAFEIEKNI